MDVTKLPEWTCHKVVRAAKIKSIEERNVTDALDRAHGAPWRTVIVDLGSGAEAMWEAPASDKIWARFVPAPGDYLVVYEDGYVSFSPAKAFEDGYARQQDDAQIPDFYFGGRPIEGHGEHIILPCGGKRFKLTPDAARSLAKMLLAASNG